MLRRLLDNAVCYEGNRIVKALATNGDIMHTGYGDTQILLQLNSLSSSSSNVLYITSLTNVSLSWHLKSTQLIFN